MTINNIFKLFYDHISDTHVIINRLGSSYGLTIRAQTTSYLYGMGVLAKGCPQTLAKRRRRGAIENARCDECDHLFPSVNNTRDTKDHDEEENEEKEIDRDLLLEMCRFDCSQIGNTSLSQLLVNTNWAIGFALIGDKEKNATKLAESIAEEINRRNDSFQASNTSTEALPDLNRASRDYQHYTYLFVISLSSVIALYISLF
jgi:hypothetical protein